MRLETELLASSDAAFIARLRLAESLTGEGDPETLDTVRLGVSEFVTNAIRHGGLATGAKIALVVEAADKRIRVEVTQPSPARGVHIVDQQEPATGGNGLRFIESIADRWGAQEGEPDSVWFELGASG